jgi:hypothetical protein
MKSSACSGVENPKTKKSKGQNYDLVIKVVDGKVT